MSNEETWEQSHAMKEEWESWQDLFGQMLETFDLGREELNKEKYKVVFDKIYKWGKFETIRSNLVGERE